MTEHVIKKGETIETIAKQYNTTAKDIIENNKIKDRTRLGIGNKLKVRANKEETKDKK